MPMRYAFIVENDIKMISEIAEAIWIADPAISIRVFTQIDPFSEWVKNLIRQGPTALANAGVPVDDILKGYKIDVDLEAAKNSGKSIKSLRKETDQCLVLVVAKAEFLGNRQLELLKKTEEIFVKKGISTDEDPTALIVTAFDEPNFRIKTYEDKVISNVIYKPFDRLILIQNIANAIAGHHLVKDNVVHLQKTKAMIEMLKDVTMESISELGFTSVSDRELTVGSSSKYYANIFIGSKTRSVTAVVRKCEAHPENPQLFLTTLDFFGLEIEQISNIRKLLKDKIKTNRKKNETIVEPARDHHFVFVEADEQFTPDIFASFERRFERIFIQKFKDLHTLINEYKRQSFPIDGIFFVGRCFEGKPGPLIDTLWGVIGSKIPVFHVSDVHVSDADKKELASHFTDLFFIPYDKAHINSRMHVVYPQLGVKEEPMSLSLVEFRHQLKAANPIEITEVSEAGLVMKYYRPIPVGDFREFILWMPNEIDIPLIFGTNNFTEDDKNTKGNYFNHFVFFGMKDIYLKHIRVWIRDNYVHTKEKAS